MKSKESFILKPVFGNLKERGLNEIDPLVYCALRSFCTTQTLKQDNKCTVSIKEIAERCNCLTKDVKTSLKRMQMLGMFSAIKDKGNSKRKSYSFSSTFQFQKIPKEVLNLPNLSGFNKGILLSILEHNNFGCIGVRNSIALKIGVSKKRFGLAIVKLVKAKCLIEEVLIGCEGFFEPVILLGEGDIEYGDGDYISYKDYEDE